jgi:hypothetical protein
MHQVVISSALFKKKQQKKKKKGKRTKGDVAPQSLHP